MGSFTSWAFKISLVFSGLCLVGCQPGQTSKNNPNALLTEAQKVDELKKSAEIDSKRAALYQKVFVQQKQFQFASIEDSKINLRIMLELNRTPRAFLYSIPVLVGQIDLQDRTEEITSQFPGQNLELSAYRFKRGTVELLALEYRFLRATKREIHIASQFVLAIADKSLGDKAIIKTYFEYPSKSDLKQWANEATQAALGAE